MARRGELVIVVRGDGWALAWPRDKWNRLTAAQQQSVIDTQTALMTKYYEICRNMSHRTGHART